MCPIMSNLSSDLSSSWILWTVEGRLAIYCSLALLFAKNIWLKFYGYYAFSGSCKPNILMIDSFLLCDISSFFDYCFLGS